MEAMAKVFTEPLVLFLAHWLSHILCWQSTNIKQMCKRCVEMWFGKSNPLDIFHRPLFSLQRGPSVKVSKVALKIRVGCKLAPTASFKLHFSPQTLFRFGFLLYSVANLVFFLQTLNYFFVPQTLFRFGFLYYSVANLLFSCKL